MQNREIMLTMQQLKKDWELADAENHRLQASERPVSPLGVRAAFSQNVVTTSCAQRARTYAHASSRKRIPTPQFLRELGVIPKGCLHAPCAARPGWERGACARRYNSCNSYVTMITIVIVAIIATIAIVAIIAIIATRVEAACKCRGGDRVWGEHGESEP